jgi:small subunit ribosomal protein S8
VAVFGAGSQGHPKSDIRNPKSVFKGLSMVSDPIADMLTRLRNALAARHPKVDVPASKLKTEIARILKEEGYILNFKVAEEGPKKTIKIYLKYATNTEPVITHISRVSRPGCRVYVGQSDIPQVLGGMGINILTTPRGVMTGRTAHKEGIGGELLCQIW